MELQTIYTVLFMVSFSMMAAQLAVRNKTTVHLMFAIFCGSMTMVAAKQLGAESLGFYQYIIGLGTCATCNGFWLVSRALFRGKSAIALRHIVVAVIIAILVMVSQGILMVNAISPEASVGLMSFKSSLGEITNLLSSSILTLTFWEAARGYRKSVGSDRWQRLMFMFSFGAAIFACSVVATGFFEKAQFDRVFPWFVVFSALQILITTQIIIVWRCRGKTVSTLEDQPTLESDYQSNEQDKVLVKGIENALYQDKVFLQANLKMIDLAQLLEVPEYRISRVFRYHFKARNFNQYVNMLRVEHAKSLMESQANQHWTVLVIGLESGFASVGPFNRAFKSVCGCTPNEYRLSFSAKKLVSH